MTKMLSEVHKILTLLVMLLLLPFVGFSESFWEGTITTANYGDLPENGLYGASNAFPVDSKVVVTNPGNGKTVEVVIKKRLAGPTVLIALSEEAGKTLGVSRGQLINGTMSLPENSKAELDSVKGNVPASDQEADSSGQRSGDTELSLIKNYIETELGGEKAVVDKSGSGVEPVLPPAESSPVETPSAPIVKAPPASVVETPPKKGPAPVDNAPAGVEVSSKSEKTAAPEIVDNSPKVLELLDSPAPLSSVMETSPGLPVPDVPAAKSASPPIAVPEAEKPESLALRPSTPVLTEKKSFRTIMLPSLGEEEKAAMERPEVVSMIARPNEETFVPPKMKVPEIAPLTKPSAGSTPGSVEKPDVFIAREAKAQQETPVPTLYVSPDLKPDIKNRIVVKKEAKVPPAKPVIPKDAEIVLEAASPKPPPVMNTPKPPAPGAAAEKPVGKEELVPPPPAKTAMLPAVEEKAPEGIEKVVKGELPKVETAATLKKGSFYLQLGAYKEEYSAKDLAFTLSGRYPVVVLVSPKPVSSRYKVMVGPLSPDEGGALLFNFRAMGYKDAFLKKGM